MPHPARSARRSNAARRKAIAEQRKPLPLAEQRRRAAERAAAYAARYPHPPVYRSHVSSYGGEMTGRAALQPLGFLPVYRVIAGVKKLIVG
jgi:hypothetical protein